MSSYSTYDSFTRADGTRYVGRYKKGKNIIEKYDADGKRTVISSDSSSFSKSGNKNALAATFDNFKSGLEAAEGGEQLSYGDDSINTNEGSLGRNIFGGNRDALTTLELSDGSILSSGAGKTGNEIKTVKRLADEIGAAFIEKEEVDTDVEVDTEVKTEVEGLDGAYDIAAESVTDVINDVEFGDTDAEVAAGELLSEVGQGAAAAFGGDKVGDTTVDTSSFTDSEATAATTSQTNADLQAAIEAAGDSNASSGSSILTSVPAASTTVSTNSALGGQQEKEVAISVGPAEDDAIDFYTEGQRGTIMTRTGGLLTDPDDPALRSRRGLIAG